MAKYTDVFPVSKNGEFFGYADAGQIARSDGALELFDEGKALAKRAKAAVDAAKSQETSDGQKIEDTKKSGGADASAVKKAPSHS